MKIENTATESGTATLHDEEHMPADYTVVFDERDGTVATVRAEVGESLADAYPAIEIADGDDAADSDDDAPEEPPPESAADESGDAADGDGEQADDQSDTEGDTE